MPSSSTLLYDVVHTVILAYPMVTGIHRSVSASSLFLFFYALFWGAIWLIAFSGWGRLVGRMFDAYCLPGPTACLLGIAVNIFLGGILNLLHAIYPVVIFIVASIGLLLYLLTGKDRSRHNWTIFWRQTSPVARLALTIALLVLVIRVFGTVRIGVLNGLDDGPGYLAFPHKMLETHYFSFDPFSERRVTTSLGAGYFLQALLISGTSIANIAMADRALGLVLLGGIVFDLGILFEITATQIAILELLVYLVPQQAMNLTFIVLPVAILLGMIAMVWRTVVEDASSPSQYALLTGMLGGAAISLKSTYLPIVGMFAVVPLVLGLGRRDAKLAFRLFFLTGFGALIILAAWMIAMKQTSSTFLFPVFGRGVDYTSYGLFYWMHEFSSRRRLLKIFLQGGVLTALAAVALVGSLRRGLPAQFCAAILIATAVAITAVNNETGGDSIWRYNFPQFFCAVIVFYIVSASTLHASVPSHSHSHSQLGPARIVYAVGIVAMLAMICYYDVAGKNPKPFRSLVMAWDDYLPGLCASLTGQRLESPQIRVEYRFVENSIPLGGVALENTGYPFLFDYHRRTIFIADWPGAASPLPGWPFGGRRRSLPEYLAGNGIRYLIYDYKYALWTDVEGCRALEMGDLYSEWLRQQWRLSILSHHQFDLLRQRFHSVYDDGKIAVIDLDRAEPGPQAWTPVWALSTPKDEMCSSVMSKFELDRPKPQ